MRKKILITGTSSGIGKELCQYFSKKHEVIRVSRTEGDLIGNLSSEEFRKEILRKLRPHIFINNAAVYPDTENPDESYQVNLMAALELAAGFSQQPNVESIINICSISPAYLGWRTTWSELHYKVQKSALSRFSEYYNLSELRKAKMTNLELGFVETDFANIRERAAREKDVFGLGYPKPMPVSRVCQTVEWILELPRDVAVGTLQLLPNKVLEG